MSDIIVSIKNLEVSVNNKKIINNISINLEKNKIYGIFGPSGAGKSTLLYSMLGLLDKKTYDIRGEIIYHKDKNIIGLKDREVQKTLMENVGVIFQQPIQALDPYNTIENSIKQSLKLKKENIKKENIKKEVIYSYLKIVGLEKEEGILDKYPYELSGGMAQKVNLALALIGKPQLILADEPTSNMDAIYAKDFVIFFKNIVKNLQSTVLFISHDLALLAQFCEYIIIIEKGEILEAGNVKEVIKNPKTQKGKKIIEESKKIYG